jgi:small GTP-binding protein
MESSRLKIVVFGPFNAGKSTFIQAIDPESRHVEADTLGGSTTVAIDYGRADILGRQVHLFGTPGQERFEFVRQITEQGMDAAILMVDCSSGIDTFAEELYNHLESTGVPFGIMLNKCDREDSCPAALREKFPRARSFEISARNPKSARDALEMFIQTFLSG